MRKPDIELSWAHPLAWPRRGVGFFAEIFGYRDRCWFPANMYGALFAELRREQLS
jgi:hypothetical protein